MILISLLVKFYAAVVNRSKWDRYMYIIPKYTQYYLSCQFTSYKNFTKNYSYKNCICFFGYEIYRRYPKKNWYILFFFLVYRIFQEYYQTITVHSFQLKSEDVGYPMSIPKIILYSKYFSGFDIVDKLQN